MASQTSDQKTDGAKRVSFEVERVAFDDHGRLLVSGRWFGVRGRRFVRPTLTLTVGPDGAEKRSLADLEHKPWAAEDGEPWLAAFPLDIKLEDAAQLELSVAPDIAVELAAGKGTSGKRGRARPEAADARAPRVRGERVRARPSTADQGYELERLRTKLAAAERAGEHERVKREEADRALEEERSEARRLRSELGRVRSELDLAAATRGELAETANELDAARTASRDADRRLQATTRALDQQRAESERLRMRVTAAEATVDRLTRASRASEREAAERRPAASGSRPATGASRPAASGSRPTTGASRPATSASPSGVETRVFGSIGNEPPVARAPNSFIPAPDEPSAPSRAQAGESAQHRSHARSDLQYVRPINPALRARPNWALRMLTLIVLLGVIAAIILVIHSTVA